MHIMNGIGFFMKIKAEIAENKRNKWQKWQK
jgi:hypothetical protein